MKLSAKKIGGSLEGGWRKSAIMNQRKAMAVSRQLGENVMASLKLMAYHGGVSAAAINESQLQRK
jgi:hypothetical protein